jgi:hypothetical protein
MAIDTTPEIERLVAEVSAQGTFRNRTEVVEAALRLLRMHQQRGLESAATAIKPKSRRQKWALAAWTIQLALTIVAVAACAVRVESILGTLPALSINGLALVLLARPLCSWRVLAYGLSGPLVSVLCAALIFAFQWSPRQGAAPVLTILLAYATAAAVSAFLVLPEVLHWSSAPPIWPRFPWQYSLKSLLWLTTAVCILAAILRVLFIRAMLGGFIIFGLFVVVTSSLAAVPVYLFLADCRRRATCPWNTTAIEPTFNAAADSTPDLQSARAKREPGKLHPRERSSSYAICR